MVTTAGGGGGPTTSGSRDRRKAIGDGTPALSVDTRGAGQFLNGVGGFFGSLFGAPAPKASGIPDTSYTGYGSSSKALGNRTEHAGAPVPDTSYNGFGSAAHNLGVPTAYGGSGGESQAAKEALLQAFATHPTHVPVPARGSFDGGGGSTDPAAGGGGGGINLASFQMPAMPTLNMPTQDYNSYLAQAQKALDFAAIAKPYDQAVNQVTNDTGISVGNIGAAAQGAHQNIAGGTALIQDGAKQAVGQEAALESALSQQGQAAAGNTAAGGASLAAALGTGGGQASPQLGAQAQAAQAALAAAAQNNSSTLQANAATQVADNQGYGRVVDAKATADQQNAELAAQDAKVGIGMQKGQSLLGAREQAATNAMGMQQNATSNAIAQYNAQVQAALGMGNLQQGEQGLGLQKYTAENQVAFQNNSLAAQVAGAKAGNLQAAYAPLFAQIANAEKYGQVNSPLTGQGMGSAQQLANAMLTAFGQQDYTPTISQGLLDGSQDSGIAPTLNDVLTKNKKR